jgi:hypothetical protein
MDAGEPADSTRQSFSLRRFIVAATTSFVVMVAVPYCVSKLVVWSWHGVVPIRPPGEGLLFDGGGDAVAFWSSLTVGADVIIAGVIASGLFRRYRRDLAWGTLAGPGAWFGGLAVYTAYVVVSR